MSSNPGAITVSSGTQGSRESGRRIPRRPGPLFLRCRYLRGPGLRGAAAQNSARRPVLAAEEETGPGGERRGVSTAMDLRPSLPKEPGHLPLYSPSVASFGSGCPQGPAGPAQRPKRGSSFPEGRKQGGRVVQEGRTG